MFNPIYPLIFFTSKISSAAVNEECLKKFEENDPNKCGAVVLVDLPKDVEDECTKKFPNKICEIIICGFDSTGALNDGSLVKEKFFEAYEHGIETNYTSNKDAIKSLLPKAFEACEPLGK